MREKFFHFIADSNEQFTRSYSFISSDFVGPNH